MKHGYNNICIHPHKKKLFKEILQQYNKNVWEERNINTFKP